MSIPKVQRLNKFMFFLTTALMVALPIWSVWFWVNFPDNARSLSITEYDVLQIENIEFVQVVLAACFNLFCVSVLVYGLWNLRNLFKCFAENQSFSDKASYSLYRFTTVLFISALLKIISTAVLSVVLTWNNPAEQKALVIQIGSNEFSMLFIAATFWAIGWTFKEGHRLTVENKEFV